MQKDRLFIASTFSAIVASRSHLGRFNWLRQVLTAVLWFYGLEHSLPTTDDGNLGVYSLWTVPTWLTAAMLAIIDSENITIP